MQFTTIFRVLGMLLLLFSLSMLPPAIVASYYQDGGGAEFLLSFAITFITGFLVWYRFRHYRYTLKTRDGFLIVILIWAILSLFGAIPLYISHHPHNSFTNAMFESVAGLTTTGATVIHGLDTLPHAILFYRQELQFLGGMGIIVLAVAVLPMLGLGGMQLYRAEIPGPMKDNKITPRIAATAKNLWVIYLSLTVLCCACYWLGGMSLFDAICESFSTISTGGFSPHDANFAYHHSSSLEIIAIIFMLLGGTNFTLHFMALKQRNINYYWHSLEFRVYIFIMLVTTVITVIMLTLHHQYHHFSTILVKSLFTVVSLSTTTAFSTANYSAWPTFIPT
ncbi:MAG: potassium transporter, partial [Gammaproteobacteria bacterium]|nr:potassium transporter [Gammaproteobacteria bacterium]